jgi:anti-sigma factor RsiW
MLSEQDEELLEAYLDDSLSNDEVERIDRRLADEPALAGELDVLRQQRRVRAAAFASLEPSEPEASAFAASVVRKIHRERMKFRLSWVTRLSGAAAACILMGLGGGWYLWGHSAPSSVMQSPATPVAVNTQNNNASPANPPGQIHFVGNVTKEGNQLPYQVELTDDRGNVVAVQKFNKLDEAQHFARDLGQVEERRQDVQSGHVTLVSDHF